MEAQRAMQIALSILFFVIWAVAIHSTYQTLIWNISVWFGKTNSNWQKTNNVFEFIAAICWTLIIVFWMN